MKITLSNSAFGDLEEIKKYYEAEGVVHIGNQFVTSIIKNVSTLADNPDIGRIVPEFEEPKIRELIHPPISHRLSARTKLNSCYQGVA